MSTDLEQLGHAALGLLQTALAFKSKGPRHHGDGENAHLTCQRGNHWRRARACAAAEARGDEHHVRAFESFDDLVGIFESRAAAHVGICSRAKAGGQPHAELQLDGSLGELAKPAHPYSP